MPLPDEEGLQQLKRIFDFLDDRDFTIDRPTWLSFCQAQNISTEALKAYKTQLLAQDPLGTEEELHRKKLEQILCCDPFDFQVANELRNLWYQKSEIQPEPFQQWAYGLSSHLLQLNTDDAAQTPLPPPPQSPHPSPSLPSPPSLPSVSQNQEWKKAVIMGGLIGSSILISTLLMRATILGLSSQLNPTPPISSPLVSSSPIVENQPTETPTPPLNSSTPLPEKSTPPPSPIPTVSSVSPTRNPQTIPNTNATIVGDAGVKNIRSGPGTIYPKQSIAYTGDRVQVLGSGKDSGGYLWYKIYSPQSGAQGWIAAQLLAVEGQPPSRTEPPIAPPTPPPSRPTSDTNASIGGNPGVKNLRSGPGTVYGVVGSLGTGERVKIVSSRSDRGGYIWYKVYHPSSGTSGWVAAQLINRD